MKCNYDVVDNNTCISYVTHVLSILFINIIVPSHVRIRHLAPCDNFVSIRTNQ